MQTLQAECKGDERIPRAFYREALNLALEAVNARDRVSATRNSRREPAGSRVRAKAGRRAADDKAARR